MQIDQLSKVGIDCDQNTVFQCGQLQQSPVSGIGTQRSGFQDVMPLTLEPLSQTASGAPVHQESHGSPTGTDASVSPEMTAWA